MYHHERGPSPPSDTAHYPILFVFLFEFLRDDRDISPDFVFSGQVRDLEAELLVDGGLDGGLGVADDVAQVAEAGDEGADVVLGELVGRLVVVPAGGAGEHGGALGLDLAGPLGDGLGVGSGVEGGLVAGGRPPRNRPSSAAWADMAARTRSLIRFRSPLDRPPNTDMIRS